MSVYNQGQRVDADQFYPVGSIIMFPGLVAPQGWLICNGGTYQRADYPELFEVIGTLYGPDVDSTAFKVPDLVGKFAEGASSASKIGTQLTPSIPQHNHTFTGSSVYTSYDGAHTHSKGTMRIVGSTNGTIIAHQGTKAWNGCLRWYAPGGYGVANTAGYGHVEIDTNQGGWTGESSKDENHTHSFTAKGTVGKASEKISMYGGTTVQPASICMQYLIKY